MFTRGSSKIQGDAPRLRQGEKHKNKQQKCMGKVIPQPQECITYKTVTCAPVKALVLRPCYYGPLLKGLGAPPVT